MPACEVIMALVPRLLPTVLSALLLGAHFLRSGNLVLVAACAAFPLVLLFRREWAVRATQAFLAVAAGTWAWTAFTIAERRIEAGQPWARMAAILGVVALLAVIAALLLQLAGTRTRLVSGAVDSKTNNRCITK